MLVSQIKNFSGSNSDFESDFQLIFPTRPFRQSSVNQCGFEFMNESLGSNLDLPFLLGPWKYSFQAYMNRRRNFKERSEKNLPEVISFWCVIAQKLTKNDNPLSIHDTWWSHYHIEHKVAQWSRKIQFLGETNLVGTNMLSEMRIYNVLTLSQKYHMFFQTLLEKATLQERSETIS